jgi:hypothetical protein
MRGKRTRYTFVIEFLGGTYVHQGFGESPELALRAWLRVASEDEFEWAIHRIELLKELDNAVAVAIDGCVNVWCISGTAGDHLFLIHIIGTDSSSSTEKQLAEAKLEEIGVDSKRWHWGDNW